MSESELANAIESVPLLDTHRGYLPLKAELDAAVLKVLDHGRFINGPEVAEFEADCARFVGTKHAIGVASGTDALQLALHAIGVTTGTEVILPSFSFFATAGVVSRLGATPVFVDIEPDTYNINPELIAPAITSKTRAIMPVHLFGQCADMKAIMQIASAHKIPVVEDAAQALSARFGDSMAGSIGRLGCFSFYPTKNLGGVGDGGLITTDDDELNELLRRLKAHGAKPKYYHKIIGYNSRLDTIQAAALKVKLPHLNDWSAARRTNAARYDDLLADLDIKTPVNRSCSFHIYNQYTIELDRREEFREFLRSRNIGHEVYYPVPLHAQECYASLGYSDDELPVSSAAAKRVCSLPIFPEIEAEEQRYVADAVKEFVNAS